MSEEEIREGELAPDFVSTNENGETIRLTDLKGKKIILYFYPKDDTPGCTKEACDFRDKSSQITDKNTQVIGVSPDNMESHKKFKDKYNLQYTLICDEQNEISKKYDVYKLKKMYGKEYMGIERSTFIIDESLRIQKIFRKVKVENHINEILSNL
tara:strand:- start:1099 stop:1563 length:465 start_codon:yes stop_codon:yes gene_type:complete